MEIKGYQMSEPNQEPNQESNQEIIHVKNTGMEVAVRELENVIFCTVQNPEPENADTPGMGVFIGIMPTGEYFGFWCFEADKMKGGIISREKIEFLHPSKQMAFAANPLTKNILKTAFMFPNNLFPPKCKKIKKDFIHDENENIATYRGETLRVEHATDPSTV